MILRERKAQAMLEYAFVIIAVIMCVVAMTTYVKQACYAKLKRSALGLNDVFKDINK